jgi:hypothetical protein
MFVGKLTALRSAPLHSVSIAAAREGCVLLHSAPESDLQRHSAPPLAAFAASFADATAAFELPHFGGARNVVSLEFAKFLDESALHGALTRARDAGQIVHLPAYATGDEWSSRGRDDPAIQELIAAFGDTVRAYRVVPASGRRTNWREPVELASAHSKVWLDPLVVRVGIRDVVCLRERVSGALLAPRCAAPAAFLGPFPRLALRQPVPFPCAPPRRASGGALSADELREHLGRVAVASKRLSRLLQWVPALSRAASNGIASKLVLVGDQTSSSLILSEAEAHVLGRIDKIAAALLRDVDASCPSAALAADKWEHNFCRTLDEHLRDCGSVATLKAVESADGQPSAEAKSLLKLISDWA